MQDNSWKQQTALIVSNSNTYSQQTNAKSFLEAEGFTVTEKTLDDIISGGYSEMMGYSAVFELNWASEARYSGMFSGTQVTAWSSTTEAAFEDYLQSGGSLYKAGELDGTGYNVQNQNAKDLLAEIGGNMTWSGSSSTSGSLNTAYRVGPMTDATNISSGYHAHVSSTDGSQMNTNNSSYEWGPNVLDNNIQGTMMVKTDFNYLSHTPNNAREKEFKTYANWLLQENEANSAIATYDTEYHRNGNTPAADSITPHKTTSRKLRRSTWAITCTSAAVFHTSTGHGTIPRTRPTGPSTLTWTETWAVMMEMTTTA